MRPKPTGPVDLSDVVPTTGSDILLAGAVELSGRIRRRDVSCVEVMRSFLDHIARANPLVNAIVSLRDPDALLAEAAEDDVMLDRGRCRGWLHGFPYAVKDLSDAAGIATTKGSPILRHNVPEADELFVSRIRAAGAIIIGKTNTPEFGLGSQTYNPVFGTTRNPYDVSRTAGGSSGGAAAALAMRMLPIADGTDFMGSLRNPAAFNNVVGFRPSFGRVPEPGHFAAISTAGPMARSVSDAAMLLSTMAGPHRDRPLSLQQDPAVFAEPLERSFAGTRLAWVGDHGGHLAMEPGLMDLCRSSFPAFEAIGGVVEEARPAMPPDQVWEAFLLWRHWQVSGTLQGHYADPATRAQLKSEAIWEVERGLTMTGADVHRAIEMRGRWCRAVQDLLTQYDFILAPTAQVFPFDAGTTWPTEINGVRMDTYHRWMETVAPWSLAGLPVLDLPVGFDPRGLPMGIQVIGRTADDIGVLQLGAAYEKVAPWTSSHVPALLAEVMASAAPLD
jgi:ureidomalonase